jgi:hypothetical protein
MGIPKECTSQNRSNAGAQINTCAPGGLYERLDLQRCAGYALFASLSLTSCKPLRGREKRGDAEIAELSRISSASSASRRFKFFASPNGKMPRDRSWGLVDQAEKGGKGPISVIQFCFRSPIAFWKICCVLICLLPGCSGEQLEPVYAVNGTITLKGKPSKERLLRSLL